MAEVVLKNLTKYYGENIGCKDINLHIEDGSFVVLLGPSGCGKTTILRLIAGLEKPTSGKIYIGSRDVTELSPKDRDIAMVFQQYSLYPHMNVYENIAFPLRIRRMNKNEIDKLVRETAQLLGIEEKLFKKPRELSGGERQRVAMGRAIVRKPKVFLFDEPLSNLDAKFRVQMRTELARIHKQLKITSIYVTHDQVEAMTLGEKIGVINKGELLVFGDPLEIYKKPNNVFVAGFVGSPPMNFIKGRIENGKFKNNDLSFDIKKDMEEREVIIGIRPEHIEITDKKGLDGVIESVENIGSETIIYFMIGETRLILKTLISKHFDIGERIKITFDRENLHFFDANTEKSLGA
jgi:multiple sugar transport system ATP-binding protein